MANVLAVALCGIVAWLLSSSDASSYLQRSLVGPRVDDFDGLREILSPNASVYLPGSDGFKAATDRWIRWQNPHFDVVVEVAGEDDVSHTIQCANQQNRPFLAISGTHGANLQIGKVEHGIGIWLRQLNEIVVSEDGKSATVGGGILTKRLIDQLWEAGKTTTTGACECSGGIAPLLGGGHGWLQGRYGLAADQLLSARWVLANGTIITVSETSYPDLFWAIRGAGHNFGIATQVQYRIYDRTPETDAWTMHTLIYDESKLEDVFGAANEMMDIYENVVELGHWIEIIRIPGLVHKPAIMFIFLYQGAAIPEKYTAPFVALEPLSNQVLRTDIRGLAAPLQMDNDGLACQHGFSLLRFPFGGRRYDTRGIREAYEILDGFPSRLNNSWLIFEGYSSRGVRTIDATQTAFPERHNDLLMSAFILYSPGDNALDKEAASYGQQLRDAVARGGNRELTAYVNYAYGSETNIEVYGHEPWRLEKLRKLKCLYDPEGRFNHYLPISVEVEDDFVGCS